MEKELLVILYPTSSTWAPSTIITQREREEGLLVSEAAQGYLLTDGNIPLLLIHIACGLWYVLLPLPAHQLIFSAVFSHFHPFLTDDSSFSLAHPITVAMHMVRRTRSLPDVFSSNIHYHP